MDAQLALELVTLLPELRVPCIRCASATLGNPRPEDCPYCQGRGWQVPELHVETVVEGMLTAGYEHESYRRRLPVTDRICNLNPNPPINVSCHTFHRPGAALMKWPLETGTDDLETCVKAALAALEREAGR